MKRLLILLFIAQCSAFGASHYVKSPGAGSQTGADFNNALSDLPTAMVRGDTYYVAQGSYGSHTFNTAASGTNAISVIYATAGNCGSVAGWNSAWTGQAAFFSSSTVFTFTTPYFTIDGVNGSNTGTNASGYGILLSTTGTGLGTGATILGNSGNPSYITLRHLECAAPQPNGSLSDFNIEFASSPGPTNTLIQYCYIHGGLVGVRFNGTGDILEHSLVQNGGGQQHSEMVCACNVNNMTLRYNVFDSLVCCLGTTYIEPQVNGGTVPTGLYIYGNIFMSSGGNDQEANPAMFSSTSGEEVSNVYLYNNTIYGLHPWSGGFQDSGVRGDSSLSTITVQNNLWQANTYGPGFQSVQVQDHNILNTGIASFVNPSGADFHLAANTTSGVTLSSPYNVDPDGVTRGGPAAWSIGAFQYFGCDPCITGQPGNQTVNCGSTATWTVTATGNTTLSYQWYKNGSAVSGATQSTYTTPATTGSDNASTWYCAVTDTAGTLNSSTATLSIELILTQPANQTVSVGQNATFSVTATTCVTSYQWNRNGSSISGATQSSFTEVNCQLSQNGNTYSCAVGTTGETSATATLTVGGITNWYASPTGSSGNTGLSTSSPWDVATAINNVGNSNIINFMDGDYTPANCPGNNTITNYWVTLKAINKWKPRFINLASDGTGGVFRNLTGGAGDGLLVDGLQFSNCQFYPILIRKQGTTNVTIRNNWIHNTGQTWTSVAGGQSGIEVYPSQAWLIERNLLEYNGTNGANAGFNHGLYLAGTNGIARDNVIRYNGGLGISVDGHSGNLDVNNQFYGNLIYSNLDASDATYTGQQLSIYNDGYSTGGPYTNYIFCNTIISQGTTPIFLQGSIDAITNNIITCGATGSGHDGIGRFASDTSATWVDYNLRNVAFQFTGTHDIVSSSYGFLNTGKGLYWLTSGSAARSAALSGVFPPADFFGNTISSVSDIGAFQYSATYATDTRTLDPSPVAGADYWSALSLNTLSHSISGQIKFSGNIVLK